MNRTHFVLLAEISLSIALACDIGAAQILGYPTILTAPRNGALAAGDLNRDGHLDLTVTGQANTVSIFLGNGLGGFATGSTVTVGSRPIDVAIEDVNADGKLDLITANFTTSNVSIALGTGSGTFGVASAYATGTNPVCLVLADVNTDGRCDVLTANQSNTISVLLGTASGALAAPTNFATGTTPLGIGVGDWDSDGKLDLAVTSFGSNRITLHRGTGTGSFVLPTGILMGTSPDAIAVADLNRDGRADLVVTNRVFQGEVIVLVGNGGGTFTVRPGVPVGQHPSDVVVADFNADGKLDVAVACDRPTVLLGDGAGGLGTPMGVFSFPSAGVTSLVLGDFQHDGRLDLVTNEGGSFDRAWMYPGVGAAFVPAQLLVGTEPLSAAVADMTGNGAADIIVANRGSNSCSVLINSGTGTFAASQSFPVGATPVAVALGDLDGDGKADAVTANSTSNTVSVLRNDGAGGLLSAASQPAGVGPFAVVVVDVSGDGNRDVVTLAAASANVLVLRGNGAGGLAAATAVPLPPGSVPTAFALVDFDRDGDQDLAVTSGSNSTLILLANHGTGSFATGSVTTLGSLGVPIGLAVGDVNRDGRSDFVVTSSGGRVGVLLDDGIGGFLMASRVDVGDLIGSPALTDANGDGLLDLAFTLRNLGSVSVLLGDGAGEFARGTSFPTVIQAQPSQLVAADLDGDGTPDLVCANSNPISNAVAALRGEGLLPFGSGTPGCDGMLGMSGATPARIGRTGFGFTVTNAPRGGAGSLMLATAPDVPGTTLLGLKLHVGVASIAVNLPVASDVGGVGFFALPIPADPALVGARLFVQTLWVESARGRTCSSALSHLVTSRGLAVTLLR